MNATRRVVITGIGLISPLGNTIESLWEGLTTGKSAVGPIKTFPVDYLPTKFAAEAQTFTGAIDEFGPLDPEKKKAIRKGLKVMCRESQMGVAAAQLALSDSGVLAMPGLDPDRRYALAPVYPADFYPEAAQVPQWWGKTARLPGRVLAEVGVQIPNMFPEYLHLIRATALAEGP